MMLSFDEQRAHDILSNEWKDLSVDEVMKRYIRIGMLLFLEKISSSAPFKRWASLNYESVATQLKNNEKVVRRLARKHGIRRQELTVSHWRVEVERVLANRWKNMKPKQKRQWERIQSPASSGINVRNLAF